MLAKGVNPETPSNKKETWVTHKETPLYPRGTDVVLVEKDPVLVEKDPVLVEKDPVLVRTGEKHFTSVTTTIHERLLPESMRQLEALTIMPTSRPSGLLKAACIRAYRNSGKNGKLEVRSSIVLLIETMYNPEIPFPREHDKQVLRSIYALVRLGDFLKSDPEKATELINKVAHRFRGFTDLEELEQESGRRDAKETRRYRRHYQPIYEIGTKSLVQEPDNIATIYKVMQRLLGKSVK